MCRIHVVFARHRHRLFTLGISSALHLSHMTFSHTKTHFPYDHSRLIPQCPDHQLGTLLSVKRLHTCACAPILFCHPAVASYERPACFAHLR